MKRPSKQRHTALRIYERLCEEYGYTSAYSTIRRYVRLIKTRLGGEKQEVFIPLEFELGSHAKVDWGEAEIILKCKRQNVYLFVMMIITTNLEFPKWNQIFGDEKMTAALLARITHNAHILITNGESYRLKQTLKRRRESNYE
ncbi:MAG: ATP-binding protein, partial [Syntrophomonadaceae bacterium]|nr:ATP-binding protein [Syntrophomonadaceae bacterium]